MKIVPDEIVKAKLQEADKIMEKIDLDDSPFLAAAIAIDADGIWSDDLHFQKQGAVKTFTTKDLLQLL